MWQGNLKNKKIPTRDFLILRHTNLPSFSSVPNTCNLISSPHLLHLNSSAATRTIRSMFHREKEGKELEPPQKSFYISRRWERKVNQSW